MPGTRGDERKDAHDNPAPRKRACPRFLPRSFDFKKGHGEKPGKQGITQAQRLKIFSSHHPPWHKQAESRPAERARQRHVTQIGSVFSSKVSVIRNAAAQRGLARSRSIPVSAKPAGKPLPASLHCLLPIATVALAVSQSEQETQGKRASPLEPPNRVVPRVNLAYLSFVDLA